MKKLAIIISFLCFIQVFAAGQGPVLVELFTSQSCSSCPPADSFITKLAKRKDVFPLSFHVDYWNYLSWVDKFSSAANTQRQRIYAKNFQLNSLYTPQVVINGEFQTSGSRQNEINNFIEITKWDRDKININYEANKLSIEKTNKKYNAEILLIKYIPQSITKVTSGENRGRTLESTNIVSNVEKLSDWQGEKKEFLLTEQKNSLIVIQAKAQARVLATYIF